MFDVVTLPLVVIFAFFSCWMTGNCTWPVALYGAMLGAAYGLSNYCNRLKDERIKMLEEREK